MSVVELTIFYTRSVVEGEFDAPSLTMIQKKRLMSGIFALLVIITGFYLYMTGLVVSKNIERQQMLAQLPQVLTIAQSVERQALTEGQVFTSRYFVEHGYEKPSSLGIIKRVRNVAEHKTQYFY